jgi:hypothetical protein
LDWSTTIVVMAAFDSWQLASLRSLTEVFGPMCLILVDQRNHFRRATPQPAKLGDDQGVGFIKDLHQLVDSALLAGLAR